MGCGLSSSSSAYPAPASWRYYSPQDVAAHAAVGDGAWTSIHGAVYSLATFLSSHPGGRSVLEQWACGKDATALFSASNAASPLAAGGIQVVTHSRHSHRRRRSSHHGGGGSADPAVAAPVHAHSDDAWGVLRVMQIGILVKASDPRRGRLVAEVESEEGTVQSNAYTGTAGRENGTVPAPVALRAQAMQRIKAVQQSGGRGSVTSGGTHHTTASPVSPVSPGTHHSSLPSFPAPAPASARGASNGARGSGVAVLQAFTRDEVARHNSQRDCWLVRQFQVYDVTSLVNGAGSPSHMDSNHRADSLPGQVGSSSPTAATAAAAASAASAETPPTAVSSSTSSPPAVAPLLDWKKCVLGRREAENYLNATLTPDQIAALLPPLHIGFLEGHSIQPLLPLPQLPHSRAGSRRGSFAAASAGSGNRPSSPLSGAGRPIDSSRALAALDAIAGDGLTVAAAEGLLASPSAVRFLWSLDSKTPLTHDTALFTFSPVLDKKSIESYFAGLSDDDRELQRQFPISISTTALRFNRPLGCYVSLEVPDEIPEENEAEKLERERCNRPLDVPFRMQRSYVPLESGPALQPGEKEKKGQGPQLVLAVKSYTARIMAAAAASGTDASSLDPDANAVTPAPGSSFLHSLCPGSLVLSTGARHRFDFEAACIGGFYETWVMAVAGTGVTAVYAMLKELLRRMALAAPGSSASSPKPPATSAGTLSARSSFCHPSRGPSSDSSSGGGGGRGLPLHPPGVGAARKRNMSVSTPGGATGGPVAPCKRIILILCNRSEEDIILGSELDNLVASAPPGTLSLFHVLSKPLFSPKHSSFTGRLNADILRLILPPSLHPFSAAAAAASTSSSHHASMTPADAAAIASLLATGAGGGGSHGIPGSRPRSPTSPQPRPDAREIAERVRAAQGVSSGDASPTGPGTMLHVPGGTASRGPSRPASAARFHFNMPNKPAPAPAPAPAPVVPASVSSASASAAVSPSTVHGLPHHPSISTGEFLHVPDKLKGAGAGSEDHPSSPPPPHPRTSTAAVGVNAAQQRLGLRVNPAGSFGESGTQSARGSVIAGGGGGAVGPIVKGTGLALICGPLGFNQDVLALFVKLGFKRGIGNLGGKDVHVF